MTVGPQPDKASAALDEDGRVATDLPCVGCEYDLRTLAPGSRCPECGEPVARSLIPTQLCLSDPAWLQGVSNGLMLVLGGLVFSACIGPTAILTQHAAPLCVAVSLAMISAGLLMVSRQEPRDGADASHLGYHRPGLRCCAWACALSVPAVLIVYSGPTLDSLIVLGPFILLALAATPFTTLMYLRDLANRIPDRRLARLLRLVLLYLLAWLCLSPAVPISVWSFGLSTLPPTIGILLTYTAILIASAPCVILLVRTQRTLAGVAHEAALRADTGAAPLKDASPERAKDEPPRA